jgi:hypothetical protein
MEVSEIGHKYGWGGVVSQFNSPGNPERLGFIYTCAGGFIDMGHVGDLIDLTWFYFQQLKGA